MISKINISLLFNTLFFLVLISCNSTKNLIKKKDLSKEQIIANEPSFGECYQVIREPGQSLKDADFKVSICEKETKYFKRAQVELIRLGYTSVEEEYDIGMICDITKNAIKDFQNRSNLIAGMLDEATLRKLISSKNLPPPSPTKEIVSDIEPRLTSYLEVAQTFLEEQLQDTTLVRKIEFKILMSYYSPSTLVFKVLNDSSNHDKNTLLIRMLDRPEPDFKSVTTCGHGWQDSYNGDKNCQVDTRSTNIDVNQIKNHIKEPSKYPLLLSRQSAIKIAKKNGFQEGIRPWGVRLTKYYRSDQGWSEKKNLKWAIENLLKQGNGSSSGQEIYIDTKTGEIHIEDWEEVGCG